MSVDRVGEIVLETSPDPSKDQPCRPQFSPGATMMGMVPVTMDAVWRSRRGRFYRWGAGLTSGLLSKKIGIRAARALKSIATALHG